MDSENGDQGEYLAILLDAMRDAVVVWDLDRAITCWNSAAENLFSAEKALRLGKDAGEVFLPHFRPPLMEVEKAPEEKTGQLCQYFPTGSEPVWVILQVTPLYHQNEPGRQVGTLCIAHDQPTLPQEQELALFAQAARMASISELASGVAHHISNPLTTIIADAQLLSRRLGQNSQDKESAEAILEAGWRAQAVIGELMKLSQPSGAACEPVSINQTIQSALLLASTSLQSCGIRIHSSLAGNLPPISANPRQLTDLWVNLLLLTRSAMKDQQGFQVLIQSRLTEEEAIEVLFAGEGASIVPRQVEGVFEPGLINNEEGRGAGLELNICREIARQNHGRIYVTSAETGSAVRVVFNATNRSPKGDCALTAPR